MMMKVRVCLLISLLLVASLTIVNASIEEEKEESNHDDESLVPLFSHVGGSDMYERYGYRIFIILGHTHTRVGVGKNGSAEIILRIPNSISFDSNGNALIGEVFDDEKQPLPLNPVLHLNHLLKRQFDDPEVQREIKVSPHKVVNQQEKPHIQFEFGGVFSPEELLSMFLGKVMYLAEEHAQRRIRHAMIFTLGCFDDNQRLAIRDVAAKVGFGGAYQDLKVLLDHYIVLYGHNLGNKDGLDRTYLVFKLGDTNCELNTWSTFGDDFFENLASITDEQLGGKEFDQRLVDYFLKSNHSSDIDQRSLLKACKAARISLSNEDRVQVNVEHVNKVLTRAEFEKINADLFAKMRDLVERGVELAKPYASKIDEYVLMGSGARIPKVRSLLKELFDGKEEHETTAIAGLSSDEILTMGGLDFQRKMIPKMGRPFVEVLPWSLGVQTTGGVMTKVMRRNDVIRYTRRWKDTFTTSKDNQTEAEIRVLVGEGRLAKECREIGRFRLRGIRAAPKGVPRIEIEIHVDETCLVTARAVDKASNASAVMNRSSCYNNKVKSEIIDFDGKIWDDFVDEERVDEEDRIMFFKSHNPLLHSTSSSSCGSHLSM